METVNNITQHSYWDGLWKNSKKKKKLNINDTSVYNYVFLRDHEYFSNILQNAIS